MTRPADILLEIVAQRRRRFEDDDLSIPSAEDGALPPRLLSTHPFLRALGRADPAIIAEVKMASPRIGSLAGRIEPEAQARLYRDGGAAALSVVVEPDFFGGSYELLARCKGAAGLPAIAKDFIVSAKQIDDAAAAGADAVLLIASLYSARDLRSWVGYARSRGLVPLIETHDAEDRTKLEGDEWELVGVNNRDLRTFEVSLDHSIAALSSLPESALRVSESGIASGADIARLAGAGFDAFLVGESLLLADDPAATLAELLSQA